MAELACGVFNAQFDEIFAVADADVFLEGVREVIFVDVEAFGQRFQRELFAEIFVEISQERGKIGGNGRPAVGFGGAGGKVADKCAEQLAELKIPCTVRALRRSCDCGKLFSQRGRGGATESVFLCLAAVKPARAASSEAHRAEPKRICAEKDMFGSAVQPEVVSLRDVH